MQSNVRFSVVPHFWQRPPKIKRIRSFSRRAQAA
jgi:hypothetical protein